LARRGRYFGVSLKKGEEKSKKNPSKKRVPGAGAALSGYGLRQGGKGVGTTVSGTLPFGPRKKEVAGTARKGASMGKVTG